MVVFRVALKRFRLAHYYNCAPIALRESIGRGRNSLIFGRVTQDKRSGLPTTYVRSVPSSSVPALGKRPRKSPYTLPVELGSRATLT